MVNERTPSVLLEDEAFSFKAKVSLSTVSHLIHQKAYE